MKVNDVLAATPLMQSVDILRNDASHSTCRLEPGQRDMGGVRFRSGDSRPTERRSAPISAPFRFVLDKFLMQDGVATQPFTVVVSIGRYSGVTADAGSREDRPWAAGFQNCLQCFNRFAHEAYTSVVGHGFRERQEKARYARIDDRRHRFDRCGNRDRSEGEECSRV